MTERSWHDPDGTLHEIYTGLIYDRRGGSLGEVRYDSGRADLRWHRCSYAFFCRQCGEIWGRIVVQDPRGVQQAFNSIEVNCEGHHDFWNVPGSMLANHLEYLLDEFPPAALRRELEVHINAVEKGII